MKSRPTLNSSLSSRDFRDFYWLKEELVVFCRDHNLPSSGSKTAITDRIAHYLDTGELSRVSSKKKTNSKFDWAKENLHRHTLITDSYKNCQNVRDFFSREIGKPFKFNIAFMAWMKANVGRSLGDAIVEWQRLDEQKRDPNFKSEIPPSLEYNRYTRDFYADNPGASQQEVIRSWKAKKSKPGHNRYERSDLE